MLTLAACSSPESEKEVLIRGETMGTHYVVRFYREKNLQSIPWSSLIEQKLTTIESMMSTYRSDSEITRFNQYQSTNWFKVSSDLVEVVATAIKLGDWSGGNYDITMGPLVNLWNFGPNTRPPEIPSEEEIQLCLKRIGYRNLDTRETPPSLRKTIPGLEIDLSSIGKGYGVDQVAEILSHRGIKNFLVEVGGEIYTRGTKPDGSVWKVGIESPLRDSRQLYTSLPLSNKAIATSGDYRNFHEKDGEFWGHIINPANGYPVRSKVASVSVIAEDCLHADGLATAMFVLGLEKGLTLASEQKVEAAFILRSGGEFSWQATSGFPRNREKGAIP